MSTQITARQHIGEKDILAIREPWEELQHHPNSDFEHYLLVCKLRKEIVSPWALSIWKEGECKGIVAGRIEDTMIRPQIGYAKLPRVKTRALQIIHEGILGEMDFQGAEALVSTIDEMLRARKVDMVNFPSLPERFSCLWEALRKENRMIIGVINPRWSVHRALTLEKKPGFLLERMRSKHRSWVKRKEKELLEAFSDKVKWSWHSNSIEVPSTCTKMEAVARTTYQRGLGAGFVDDYETRNRLSLFAKRNQLRVMLLELDVEPSCFWYGVVYKSTFHASATGYRPDMARYEMGTLALLKMVDYLIAEGIEKLDFGLGDAYYKERFSDVSWREASCSIFANTTKGLILRNYIKAASWLDACARSLAEDIRLTSKIKKVWRQKVRGKLEGSS